MNPDDFWFSIIEIIVSLFQLCTHSFRYEDIVADIVSDDESPARYRTAADYKQKKSAALSERPKALFTVGETRKIVQDEKDAGRRKMGVSYRTFINLQAPYKVFVITLKFKRSDFEIVML